MALDVSRWAWRIIGLRPAHKFVLLALADYADNLGIAFPSQAELVSRTGLDRKTIQQAINTLIDCGALEDTGQRCGGKGRHDKPGRVIVYRVLYDPSPIDKPKNGPVFIGPKTDQSENGPTLIGPETDLSPVDKSADSPPITGTIGPKTDQSPFKIIPLQDNIASFIGPFFPRDRPENGPIDRPVFGLRNQPVIQPVNPAITHLPRASNANGSQRAKRAPGQRIAEAAERKAAIAAQRAKDAETAQRFLEGLRQERDQEAR